MRIEDLIWVIPVIMIVVSLFVPPPTDAEISQAKKEDEEYEQQRRWEERRAMNASNSYQSEPDEEPQRPQDLIE